MASALLQSTSHQSVQVVPVSPKVKSAKTCKLFKRGVSELAGSAKSADPIVYNARVGWETSDGLFETMETIMKDKAKLRVNDLVRVKQSGGGPGPTLYLLEWIGERQRCVIREAGNPLAGGQEFDLSLLVKASRDLPARKVA